MKRMLLLLATALLASLALAVPAWAVVNNPPQPPHDLTIFPERDFVPIEGYSPNTAMNFLVERNGVVIGQAKGTTDSTGFLEVNHPGGVCWTGSTPNILPGDVVSALEDPNRNGLVEPEEKDPATGNGDTSTTINVTAEQAFINADGNVEVNGTAEDLNGGKIDIAKLEQRIVQPAFRDTPGSRIERRDIRADSTGGVVLGVPGGAGNLTYDDEADPNNVNWTAIYTGLNDTEKELAVAGETRILSWLEADAAGNRFGITIYEVGVVGGPGFGGCPASADYAVTSSDPTSVNATTKGQDLVVSGVSQDASSVSVSLDDANNPATPALTATATPTPALDADPATTQAQTWSATFPGASVAGFSDGTLTATGTYTRADGDIGGVNLKIKKDTVVPNAPTATPAAGSFNSAQAVTLRESDADPQAKIFYEIGSTPANTPNPDAQSGIEYTPGQQIQVTASQTIKAVVVDGAGNTSEVATFEYTIDTVAPAAPRITSPANNSSDADGSFTLSGTAEANSTVEIFEGTASLGTATASATGAWSKDLSGVTNGSHTYTAKATDAAGNVSSASTAVTIVVGAAPPPPAAGAPSVTGLQPANGTTTRDRTPAIRATVRDAQSELTKSNIQLFVDGSPLTTFTYNQNRDTLSATSPQLSLGSHTVKVVATDPDGNSTTQESTFSVVSRR